MDRLSLPLTELRPRYDVVVVGSGYGGSIAACRLARTGKKVALLERGREMLPGEYPATMQAAARHFQTSSPLGDTGDPRGLYWLHVGGEMNVFSGCGLGGTSLVNANVALRPDPRIFEDERWPTALRADPTGLDAGFKRARAMLTPTTYPPSYPPLAKVEALRRAAGGTPFSLVPINVTFRAGPNAAGVHQEACTGCGDCVTGCNFGAKNTLLMNYLPDAVAHDAEIFSEVDVRWVEREVPTTPGAGAPIGWVVRAQPLGIGRDRFDAPPLAIAADTVVLAAGTLGTARVLLQSRAHGLVVSSQLGQHFTGNGDVLGFSYRKGRSVRAVGAGHRRPDAQNPAGPCIAAFIDGRSGRPLNEGVIIEDAVVPGAVAGLLPLGLLGQLAPDWARGRLRGGGPLSALVAMFTRGRRGLTSHLQTLLAMGNDDDEGELVLDDDRVRVNWPGAGTSAYYELANRVVGTAASADGDTFLRNPVWSRALGHSLITVHPLGGCVMADRAEHGVVDDLGRVFAGSTGDAVHDGLLVWDGSVIPRPLGVNPLLTISALTERAVAALASAKGWVIDETSARRGPPPEDPPTPPTRPPGLRFTERMAGHWAPSAAADAGDPAEYERAAEAGAAAGTTLAFVLTLSTGDLPAVIADLGRPMTATGTVEAPALSSDPLTVDEGTFQLLVPDDRADTAVQHMWYRLPLAASDGRRFHFSGFKALAPGDVAGVWPATTTLYVTLRQDDAGGAVIGRGCSGSSRRTSPPSWARWR
jgi:cholesterol oxidase